MKRTALYAHIIQLAVLAVSIKHCTESNKLLLDFRFKRGFMKEHEKEKYEDRNQEYRVYLTTYAIDFDKFNNKQIIFKVFHYQEF